MSNEEAKFLLNAYRSNGRDATDPAFAAALEQAKTDPALAAWFSREQAHAAAVAGKLRELAPPAGLRDAILAGGRATSQSQRPRLRLARPLALAAGVAVAVGLGMLVWPKASVRADSIAAIAFEDVRHGQHGGHGPGEQLLQTALTGPGTHLAAGLPIDFTELARTGCRTLQIGGHDVLEVCFQRDGAEYHCYIARVGDFRLDDAGAAPKFIQQGSLAAAALTRGAYHVVVVSNAGLDAVKRLL